ncbi:hypothetical protein PIROE2DRAFT_1744 [Piromyces sp. E2]|nr:hypothetical protein PIROE2DRAFT_1744 [Piromyces sp. E2]|eukprot:OUM70069.1 hypothetical protein PIROE2DRAFT_1744 [Piromyces sp. E2]
MITTNSKNISGETEDVDYAKSTDITYLNAEKDENIFSDSFVSDYANNNPKSDNYLEINRDFLGSTNNFKILLTNVYYTPEIKRNLISDSSLIKDKDSYKVVFNLINNISYSIYNDTGKRISSIPANDSNTYRIWIIQHPPTLT